MDRKYQELDILDELIGIYIKVDSAGMAECYYNDDEMKFNDIVSKNRRFMAELFKDSDNNRDGFKWGEASFNNGSRTYNAYIEIEY